MEHYEDVFEAYREKVYERATVGTKAEDFNARRERTRAARLARYR